MTRHRIPSRHASASGAALDAKRAAPISGRRPRPALRLSTALALLATLGLSAPLPARDAAATSPPAYARAPQNPSPTDHTQLVDLIARMNHAIDAGDYAAYAGFYADGGAIDSGFGPPVTGRASIVASLEKSAPFISNKRHVASNIVIEVSGDSATAVYYLIVFERASGLTLAGTALITDTFRRRDGRWEVTTHTTRMDPATLEAMSAAMARGGG